MVVVVLVAEERTLFLKSSHRTLKNKILTPKSRLFVKILSRALQIYIKDDNHLDLSLDTIWPQRLQTARFSEHVIFRGQISKHIFAPNSGHDLYFFCVAQRIKRFVKVYLEELRSSHSFPFFHGKLWPMETITCVIHLSLFPAVLLITLTELLPVVQCVIQTHIN